jgi:signal transduction histidine kinase
MGKGLGKPLIACFCLIILMIVVIVGVSIRGFNVVYSNSHLVVSDVLPLRNTSSGIKINLLTLETSLRGYLLSQDQDYVSTCTSAKQQLGENLARMTKFTTGLPELKKLIMELKPQVNSLIEYFDNEMFLIDSGGRWKAYNDAKSGKVLMDNINVTINQINENIENYSKEKIYNSENTKNDVTDILISVSIVVFLLIIAITAMVAEIITENINHNLKQNMSLEKTIKDQEEFYANISHELKTPLNVILSTIQLLDMYNKNDTKLDSSNMNRYFNIMKQNCFRLSRLSNNLIDISKIEAGYVELNLDNLDIVSTIEDITQSVVDYGSAKGISLIFDTNVEEKLMAFDADKIERIMLNLLSNAFKFTNPGDEINVYVKDHENHVSVSVKDTGIGIPEDKLEIVFDRFKQVDKSLKRNTEGSGIGLALTKSLISMHGGTISVNSKLGEGSEFVFELPVKLIDTIPNDLHNLRRNTDTDIEKITIEFSDIYFD